MANFYYSIPFEILELDTNQNIVSIFCRDIPYFNEVKTYLEDVWTNANIHQYFPDTIKDKIKRITCKISPPSKSINHVEIQLTIEPIQGFRWTNKRRIQVWHALNAQVTDGFGETLQFKSIPNVPERFVITF